MHYRPYISAFSLRKYTRCCYRCSDNKDKKRFIHQTGKSLIQFFFNMLTFCYCGHKMSHRTSRKQMQEKRKKKKTRLGINYTRWQLISIFHFFALRTHSSYEIFSYSCKIGRKITSSSFVLVVFRVILNNYPYNIASSEWYLYEKTAVNAKQNKLETKLLHLQCSETKVVYF